MEEAQIHSADKTQEVADLGKAARILSIDRVKVLLEAKGVLQTIPLQVEAMTLEATILSQGTMDQTREVKVETPFLQIKTKGRAIIPFLDKEGVQILQTRFLEIRIVQVHLDQTRQEEIRTRSVKIAHRAIPLAAGRMLHEIRLVLQVRLQIHLEGLLVQHPDFPGLPQTHFQSRQPPSLPQVVDQLQSTPCTESNHCFSKNLKKIPTKQRNSSMAQTLVI